MVEKDEPITIVDLILKTTGDVTKTSSRIFLRLEAITEVLKEKNIITQDDYERAFDRICEPENLEKILKRYFKEDLVDDVMKDILRNKGSKI